MFTFYARMYANGAVPLSLASDRCLCNTEGRFPTNIWKRAYLTDLAALTGNPDGENW